MSILNALKQQNSSIDSLAALPQAMIMQMAQRKEISEAMVAPILARKAELADAFARQNILANASKAQPTVMEQLLAKNAQAEQPQMPEQMPQQVMPQEAAPPINPQAMPQGAEDVGIATQATQPMSMAGGGIVAFSKGDFIDEDDDEDAREEADYATMMSAALSGARNIPHKISELASRLPKSYADTKAQMSHEKAPKMGGHKYEELVLAEAKRQGVDPKLALHVLYKETGGHKDPANAKSHAGALGPMQIMPRTAKDLGIDPSDPVQNIHGGVKYLAQLGPMFDNNPRLTAAAYNAGPGNVRKHGGVPNFKETQNYVVGLAHGGEVQHYASKGYVEDEYSPEGVLLYGPDTRSGEEYGVANLNPNYKGFDAKEWEKKYGKRKVVPPKMPDELKNAQIPSAPQEVRDNSVKVMPLPQGQAQAPVMPKSGLENFMEQMVAQKSELAKQRAEDKNMALLTAGLGMLGGTSQYAFENIGKGALAGVQNLGEARKSRAAEQNAIDRNLLYAHRYQGVEDVARQNAAAQQAYRGETLRETARANTNKELEHAQSNFNNYLKIQQDNLKARFPAGEMDPGYQAAMAALQRSAPYLSLAKRAGYDMPQAQTTFTPKQESLLSKYLPK